MRESVAYYCELYRANRYRAIALDIETQSFDGPISLVSFYRKIEPDVGELVQITHGCHLNQTSIREELAGAKVILTFNGLEYDLPKIEAQYPGAVSSNARVIDLLLLARSIGFKGGLKEMEKVLGISRSKSSQQAIGKTHRLWREYIQEKKVNSLNELLDYAASDVRNLYDLAEILVTWADAKLALNRSSRASQQTGIDCIQDFGLSFAG